MMVMVLVMVVVMMVGGRVGGKEITGGEFGFAHLHGLITVDVVERAEDAHDVGKLDLPVFAAAVEGGVGRVRGEEGKEHRWWWLIRTSRKASALSLHVHLVESLH